MRHLIQFSSIVFALMLFSFSASAQMTPLNYGDVVNLKNGWNKNKGGFLDTRGYQKDFEKTGNFLCVSTAKKSNRDGGSGSWKVLSATGKADGTPVLVGDVVHLQNQWNKNGGYLDTRGYQKDFEKTGNHLCVSTSKEKNRDSGSGTWKITSAKGLSVGTPLTKNSSIHLQNGWNRFRGGYLDTRGYQKDFEKTGNFLCVSTATGSNRDSGSGTWKITKVISNSSSLAASPFNPNKYYRLTTQFTGEGKSLDIINDAKDNRLTMAKTGRYTGQYWKIESVGNGYYRLTTKFTGKDKSLDIINDDKDDKLEMRTTGRKTGQYWKIESVGGGYYRLTTQFTGKGKSLDIINDGKNNRLHMRKTDGATGQKWKITEIR
ncbi:MAG: RICIN domain-containing protein [Bacteroidota bacterium]